MSRPEIMSSQATDLETLIACYGRLNEYLMQLSRRHEDLLRRMPIDEVQQSFNMHYLQLRQQMQNENRRFTTLSNIMKTKHETAMNAIRNIR